MSTFGDRLEEALDGSRKSQADLARDSGVSTQTIKRWKKRDEPPGLNRSDTRANLQALCDELHVRREWLLEGVGKKKKAAPPAPDVTERKVRHFGPAEAGDGRTLEPRGYVQLTEGEYRARFGGRGEEQVGLFRVVGDSAAPMYFEGEDVPVEVKGDTQEFREDTVYVFRYRNDLMIKRLRTLEAGNGKPEKIRAQSLNPGIEDRILEPNENNFEIIGRVIDTPKQQLYSSMVNRFMREKGQE